MNTMSFILLCLLLMSFVFQIARLENWVRALRKEVARLNSIVAALVDEELDIIENKEGNN